MEEDKKTEEERGKGLKNREEMGRKKMEKKRRDKSR